MSLRESQVSNLSLVKVQLKSDKFSVSKNLIQYNLTLISSLGIYFS